jgi:hypothetical protein
MSSSRISRLNRTSEGVEVVEFSISAIFAAPIVHLPGGCRIPNSKGRRSYFEPAAGLAFHVMESM